MKNTYNYFVGLLFLVMTVSCTDKFEIVKDNRPEIPVTFDDATTAGFNPYYTVSYAGNAFTITLSIPQTSKHQIKEVTNIVTGTTAINASSLNGTAGQYLTAPAAVNGYAYTLTTSITEFNTKVAGSTKITTSPAAGTFAERAFMFKLTMDDDSVIIPVQCRIRVTP
jgi:hypothetical protein